MRFTIRAIVAAIVAMAPLACTRYEPVPGQVIPASCANRRPPAGPRSFTPEEDLAADSGTVRGRLILSHGEGPLPRTSVDLLTNPPRRTTSDSLGVFTFEGISPGTYFLRTRHVGVHSRTDTLHLVHAHSAAIVVMLDPEVTDDPCDAVTIVVRKPWWKVW